MRTYATVTQFDNLYGTGTAANEGITDATLAEATITIDELLIGAVYDVTGADELPADTGVAATLRDAVCAQARWIAASGDPSGQGLVANLTSASIGSVSWSANGSLNMPGGAGQTTSGRLVGSGALSVLRVAGLLPAGVYVTG